MSKHILIVWNITEWVEIQNSASSWQKNTSHLTKDNALYIDVLDYWTNLVKIFFSIPSKEYDWLWVDLIYESTIDQTKKFIDIKTQAQITQSITLYMREFGEQKIQNRNFIIFNKNKSLLIWNIFFISSKLIEELSNNEVFITLQKELGIFAGKAYNYIQKDTDLKWKYDEIVAKYNKKSLSLSQHMIYITFLTPRKDNKGLIGNTNFIENICIKIQL